jgi:hypothetical protein
VELYRSLSHDDERAARSLLDAGQYRQAVYFVIQAMEKVVHWGIWSEVSPDDVDSQGVQYQERTRTHHLDDLLAVLLEVYKATINDPRVSQQIEEQLSKYVLEGVHFGYLHNNVRYPRYLEHSQEHTMLEISAKDAESAVQKLVRLRAFVEGFQRLKQVVETVQEMPSGEFEATAPESPEHRDSLWKFSF